MKLVLLKIGFFALTMLGTTTCLKAQVDGEYRSSGAGTGKWSEDATWEVYDADSGTWGAVPAPVSPATATPPGTTSTVTIKNGHTVIIDGGTKSVKKITIENGATLKSDGTRNLRVVESVINNGTFGGSGSGERISIEGYATSGDMLITGNGNYLVGLIRCNGVVQNVRLIIDADINMSQYISGPYTLSSGTNNSLQQGDDDVEIIINAGKTVTMTGGSASYLHGPSASTTISTDFYGKYTYTINGTLDMAAAGTSCIVAHNTTAVPVTVNVNGTWKLGSAVRTASNFATIPAGAATFNIGNSGVVDATAVSAGTNLVMTANSGLVTFFNITGNGIIKQNPSKQASHKTFRIGTGGFYSPLVINTATAPNAVFSANVSSVNDQGKKMVNRVWSLSADAPVSDLTLNFGATTDIEKNGFNIADPVKVYRWDGTIWDAGANTSVAGTGTIADLHTAEVSSVNTLGKFSVANETPAVLPLKFIDVNAKLDVYNNYATVSWQTTDEKNTADFLIQKSLDGKNFYTIGTIISKNTAGLNQYSFVDKNIEEGTSYYRIIQKDIDGRSEASKIVVITTKAKVAIALYPNPSADVLNVTHALNATGTVQVIDLNGKILLSQALKSGATITTLNINKLIPATYVLKVSSTNGDTIQKFIKL